MKPLSEENDCKVALSWAPEGKRRRGRPKTTWRRTVEKEWEEVRTAVTNQEEWKSSVKALCATRHKEDRIGHVRNRFIFGGMHYYISLK